MAAALYDPGLYDPRPVDSYWELSGRRLPQPPPLSGERRFEVAVVGGGYTGLSAALHLARDHHISVCVLEAGHIGWGASSRNGGFACIAAAKLTIEAMVSRYGMDETKRFFAAQLEGLELVRELCESEGIDCDLVGDGNLEVAHMPSRVEALQRYAFLLNRCFGIPTRAMTQEEFAAEGFQSTEQFGGIHIGAGFGLHPQKFVSGLAEAALRHGAVLYPHSEVRNWRRLGTGHVLSAEGGSVIADRVVMATNGYTREGLHRAFDGRLLPAVSNIITTRPLTDEELAAHGWRTRNPVVNSRTLLFYFRLLPDNRFLFGSRGDTTGTEQAGLAMKTWMSRRLAEVFPHWRQVPITHHWRGLICMTRRRTPSIGRLAEDPTVYYAFGYHGNGVNTAPWAGRQIARMIAQNNDGAALIPLVCRGNSPRFPLAPLRLWYLRAAYRYYRFRDAL